MKASRKDDITQAEIIYAIVMRYGRNRSITVKAAHELELPKKLAILANPVGTDLDISVMVDDEIDKYLSGMKAGDSPADVLAGRKDEGSKE